MCKAVFKAVQPDMLQCFNSALPGFIRRKTQVQRAKGHIFKHGRKEKLVFGVLQHKAHAAAKVVKIFFGMQFAAMKAHNSLLRARQAGYAAEKRGFSTAVGTVKSHMLSRHEGHINAPEHRMLLSVTLIAEVDVFKGKNGAWRIRGINHKAYPCILRPQCPRGRAAQKQQTGCPVGGL